ncbi:MAG: S9 family peptidase [Verrucomicrobia bacterium]|nr:S9 family peptidase [Verrucomicrobiota bacterium]
MAAVQAASLDLKRVTPVPATEPIPTMDFFRPRVLSQPVLNPSGTHIAAVITDGEDKHDLLVYGLADRMIETVGGSADKDIYSVHWLNDSRLMFNLSSRKLYGIGLLAADVGDLSSAYPLLQYAAASLVSIPLKNRLQPLVWRRRDVEIDKDHGVSVINSGITTGKIVDLQSGGNTWSAAMDARDNNAKHIIDTFPLPPSKGVTYHYGTDKAGELAYCYTSDKGNRTMFRLVDKQWVKCPVDLEQIDIVGAGNEPGQLCVLGPRQEGKPRALQLMDAATGKLGDVVLQDQTYDFNGGLYRNPATGDVLGAIFNRNIPQVFWFNEEYQALQKILDGMFPGLVVRIIDSDTKHKIFLVATRSAKQPAIYSWVDLEQRKSGLFKNSAPWIDPTRMQEMKMIKFKTRDGRRLDAYLTFPASASKENPPPLVVLAHGGPWARDTWGFNGEVQFLASHGYAVMQPNYRGSTGYCGMFPEEDEWNFIKMHNDVTDATKALIASGLVDKNRVGIMGGSFGGYLAISGVAHEPELYRCAVTEAGVFDWALHVQSKKYDQYDNSSFGRLMKKLGDPKKDAEKFAAMSPINFVDKIRVPVFVAGGKEDQTVEIQQSKRLVSALNKYNVPYEKLFIGGEAHGMAYLKDQVELYDRIITFLDKNLMPKK